MGRSTRSRDQPCCTREPRRDSARSSDRRSIGDEEAPGLDHLVRAGTSSGLERARARSRWLAEGTCAGVAGRAVLRARARLAVRDPFAVDRALRQANEAATLREARGRSRLASPIRANARSKCSGSTDRAIDSTESSAVMSALAFRLSTRSSSTSARSGCAEPRSLARASPRRRSCGS